MKIHIQKQPCVKVIKNDFDEPVPLDTAGSKIGIGNYFKTCNIKRVEDWFNG